MFEKYSSRREFIKYIFISFLLFLNSCRNVSKKVKIALQNSFYPDDFKSAIPKNWQKNNFNFVNINEEKKLDSILESDFTLINDGWINNINFNEFKKINDSYFLEKLDRRSRNFLNTFEENKRNKLFPIGVVPFAIIIKNNKDLINSARESWDFLLSKRLSKKIIFPESPRIMISIAEKINSSNTMAKLKRQAKLFDDQNALNWLINSDSCVAIVPYSLCSKYLKIDSRLSVVFPNQGVPLMWHFALNRSNLNTEILLDWIKSLESKSIVDKLANQGWHLPFINYYSQSKYKFEITGISGPSEQSWANSWSFPTLTNEQKINFENTWNNS